MLVVVKLLLLLPLLLGTATCSTVVSAQHQPPSVRHPVRHICTLSRKKAMNYCARRQVLGHPIPDAWPLDKTHKPPVEKHAKARPRLIFVIHEEAEMRALLPVLEARHLLSPSISTCLIPLHRRYPLRTRCLFIRWRSGQLPKCYPSIRTLVRLWCASMR